MHSGTLEHMCINPDGPLCYCGSRGCLETYCSANALEQAAGIPAKEFFPLLREKKSPQIIQIWKDFLNHLAFAMKNLNLLSMHRSSSADIWHLILQKKILNIWQSISIQPPHSYWIKHRFWSVPTDNIHRQSERLCIMWREIYSII